MDVDLEDTVPDLVEIPDEVSKVIPITILSGFLGSGKTTLLNYILTSSEHKKKIAVIENEFSEGLGIEGLIAKSGVNGENISTFFELNNGCICCTVKDDLVNTLEQLALHKDKFDYILIETTGMANPGPVITSLWLDSELGTSLQLDGVVCVVDAANISYNLSRPEICNEVTQQICYADRILVNKADLVSAEQLDNVQNLLTQLNGLAEKKVTSFSRVDLEFILSIRSYCTDSSYVMKCLPCDSQGGDLSPTISSSNEVNSLSIKLPGRLDLKILKLILDDILYGNGIQDHKGPSIFRMKGLLHVVGCNQLHILQSVHSVFDIQSSACNIGSQQDPTNGVNVIVVIGCSLNGETLKSRLEKSVVAAFS